MTDQSYELNGKSVNKEHENALRTLRSLYDHINLLDVNTLKIKMLLTLLLTRKLSR